MFLHDNRVPAYLLQDDEIDHRGVIGHVNLKSHPTTNAQFLRLLKSQKEKHINQESNQLNPVQHTTNSKPTNMQKLPLF